MAWNESPQTKILQFVEPFFPGCKVEVRGSRMRRGTGGHKAPYTAYLVVDGKVLVSAQERNWRQAYKTLQINISKTSLV